MPADKYGKSLYKAGTMKSEKAAIANRDPARKKAAEKIMKREGTTSPAGGRAAAAGLGAVAASEAAARAAAARAAPGLGAVTDRELQMLKKAALALKRKAPGLGAVTDRELQMLKKAAPKIKPMPKIKPTPAPRMSKPVQVIRTTTAYKPTPTKKTLKCRWLNHLAKPRSARTSRQR
jgi:hypothetical protein